MGAVYLPAVTNLDNERFPFKMRCLEAGHHAMLLLQHAFAMKGHLVKPVRSAAACAQVLQHRMESCLAAGRSVVLAGDLNVAPFAIDHCDYANAPARSVFHPAAGHVPSICMSVWKLDVLHFDVLGSRPMLACNSLAGTRSPALPCECAGVSVQVSQRQHCLVQGAG